MNRLRDVRRDDGFTLVLCALVLVVLMIFAAFAVDLGGVYNARRQDQSAADSATLGAAQDLDDNAEILNQVDILASNTLGISTGSLNWNSCGTASTSGDPDSVDTPITVGGSSYNCITKDADASRLQVRLPGRQYDSLFAAVVGIDGFNHSAFAIAGTARVGFGSILPFGLAAAASDSSYACLKDSPHDFGAPCDGPDAGNFNYLDFKWFGDGDIGTTQTCTGSENERLSNNIAAGIDHDLQKYSDTVGEIIENDECGGLERRPNSVRGETGNRTSAFGSGMYSGDGFTDGGDAKLRRPAGISYTLGYSNYISVDGYSLNNVPLWEFIDVPIGDSDGNGVVSAPDSCEKNVFTSVYAGNFNVLPNDPINVRGYVRGSPERPKPDQMRMLLERCFDHYRGIAWSDHGGLSTPEPSDCPTSGCVDAVFARDTDADDGVWDIQHTPRFGYVPQLSTNFGSGTSTLYHITSFRAVFMQRLLGSCNATSCDLDFEPGSTGPTGSSGAMPITGDNAPNGGSASAITSWVFPPKMLPGGLADESAPFDLGVNRFLRLLR